MNCGGQYQEELEYGISGSGEGYQAETSGDKEPMCMGRETGECVGKKSGEKDYVGGYLGMKMI